MPESSPNPKDSLMSRQIADLKRRRVVGLLVALGALALGALLGIVCANTNKNHLVPIVLVPFLGIGLHFLIRVFGTKCPACGKLFFNAPVRSLYASACYHCGIGETTAQQEASGGADKPRV